MTEVLLPPWVLPVNPEKVSRLDDAGIAFPPQLGRGMTQTGIWADPRWKFTRTYRGMRSDELAAINGTIDESRGAFNTVRATVHAQLRGTWPTSEHIPNNTFASSGSGWGASTRYTLSVGDRVMRATRQTVAGAATNALFMLPNTIAVDSYQPYCVRYFLSQGRGQFQASGFSISEDIESSRRLNAATTSYGMLIAAYVPVNNFAVPVLIDETASGSGCLPGDFFNVHFASYTRCALVDASVNYFQKSDDLSATPWTGSGLLARTANYFTAPDGTTTGTRLVENAAAGVEHYAEQIATRANSLGDWGFAGGFRKGDTAGLTRDRVRLRVLAGSQAHNFSAFFHLTSGTLLSTNIQGSATNVRGFIKPYGTQQNWFYCCVVGRLPAGDTTVSGRVMLCDSANNTTYAGDSASNIGAWHVALAPTGVPMHLAYTNSTAATSGEPISGSQLRLKGLPNSAEGLLEIGDWFEWGGELKKVTGRLNSDGVGLGIVRFRPSLAGSPQDNQPVIPVTPFGRFRLVNGTIDVDEQFGRYGEAELQLEERYT